MMKRLFVICQRYYDNDFHNVTIGGIQTYISNLCQIGNQLGFRCCILQFDTKNREREFLYGKVIGVDVSQYKRFKHKSKALFNCFKEMFCPDTDVLVYATEELAQKESRNYAVSIQHGISWDIQSNHSVSRQKNIFAIFKNAIQGVRRTRYVFNTKHLICVDYNYPNWYRTQVRHPEAKITVIPNFASIAPECLDKQFDGTALNILFARRFQPYRGSRLFASVMQRLLGEYPDISLTLAGDGPDEQWLRDTFAGNDRVVFTHYKSDESLEFHTNYHIAVVPTVGSEGTSLSLLEAMSAQCAVVCTNVGGMTNIVIDNYNGLMVNADEESLYFSIKQVITDQNLRFRLAQRAYETVREGFSYDLWKARWIDVLKAHTPNQE